MARAGSDNDQTWREQWRANSAEIVASALSRNYDNSGHIIYDPEHCDRGPCTIFSGYMYTSEEILSKAAKINKVRLCFPVLK